MVLNTIRESRDQRVTRRALKIVREVLIHTQSRTPTHFEIVSGSRRRGILLALLLAPFMLLLGPANPAAAKMKKPISVYPLPKTPVASDSTTFSFRGIKKKNLGPIVVTGQQSGRHRGRLLAHSDGRGVSFIPKRKFKRGELVTVRTRRWIRGARGGQHGRFWVRIGRFYGSDEVGEPAPADPVVGTLKSRPGFKPPVLDVKTLTPAATQGKIFFAPKTDGMTITDRQGRILWFRPVGYGGTGNQIYNFRTQRYRGKPVLTYWKGASSLIGYSQVGHFEILNRNYRRIARFKPGNGYEPDIHEFVITPQSTALVLAYRGVRWDARKFGGNRNSKIMDNVVQEVDIKTGAVLFEWHALGNVGIGASQAEIPDDGTPFDYWHANSIDHDGRNALLVSARKTSTVYRINRWNGKIMWALRGSGTKGRSDFTMGAGTQFGYQHDALRLPNGDISLFDNGSGRFAPVVNSESSGLVLRLRGKTKATRTATLVRRNVHTPDPIVSGSQGNAQPLPDDGMFVGWGSYPQMTEYDKDGNIVFDMAFPPAEAHSYRAFKAPWHGIPQGRPAIASEIAQAPDPEGLTVWVSWNGASDVREWRVLTGADEGSLTEATTVPWENLETEIEIPGTVAAKVQVEALDKDGQVLGRTAVADAGTQVR